MLRLSMLLLAAFSLIPIAASARKKEIPPAVTADSFARRANELGLLFNMRTDRENGLGIVFGRHNSFRDAAVKDTLGLEYAYAMTTHRGLGIDYEIRYSIWPLRDAVRAYDSCRKTAGCTMPDPNTLARERAAAMIRTMSGGKETEILPDTTQGAAKVYNADEIGRKSFKLSTDFTFSYIHGHLRYLHKDNVADIVITELGNVPQQYAQLMLWATYGLTFKP